MKDRFMLATLCTLSWVYPAAPTAAQPSSGGTHRFALVVGANHGGADRAPLRYALSDARAFETVLRQLGGVAGGDGSMLEQPDPAALANAFEALRVRMEAATRAGERVEFIFYYSGHSDEQGLHLRDELVLYKDVRAKIDTLPAEVRIGVLDSCASGALTRLKGGSYRPPFLVDASTQVRGHAFLTSSSESEAAQESDRIRASFFTHFLVSGLRGAADFSGDGQVTLSEAYRFAFDETLARTESTQGGAQHPAYDIRLAGTGDVVMTDLRQTSATLAVDKAVEGRVFIRDAQGRLAAELWKPAGRAVALGLSPGEYTVVVETPARLSRAEVSLTEGARVALSNAQLVAELREPARARGAAGRDATASNTVDEEGDEPGYRTLWFSTALFYPADTNAVEDRRKVKNHLSLNFLYGRAAIAQGLQLGVGVHHLEEDLVGLQLTAAGNVVERDMLGAQLSAGVNIVNQSAVGAQATAGLNWVGHDLSGVQLAAGANLVGRTMEGLQMSAGFNAARKLQGAQLTGGLNAVEFLDGAQISPINLAREARGLQLGVVNVGGRVRGLQLGVFNYADEADAQFGVLSLSRRHGVSIQSWTSDTALLSTAVRFNAGVSYGLLVAAVHPFGDGEGYSLGIGFGGTGRLDSRLAIDIDATYYTLQYGYGGVPFDGEQSNLAQLRAMLRIDVANGVGLFGGPAFNVLIHQDQDDFGRRPGYDYAFGRDEGGSTEVAWWPGLVAGIQLL